MTVNELVLHSLNNFEDFKIQVNDFGGKVKNETLTKEMYMKLYNENVQNYYIDIDKNINKPFIVIILE